MTNISEIGAKIKILREQKGLSQKEFGKLIGCPQTTVAGWENQEKRFPRKQLITPIAKALDVSEGYLLGVERENIFKIKHLGSLKNNEIKKDVQKYTEVTENEYGKNRFSLTVRDCIFEPYISKKDYCIFEEAEPENNDIVLVEIDKKYYLKKWKEVGDTVVLILNENDSPIIKNKREKKDYYKGKLLILRRYLK